MRLRKAVTGLVLTGILASSLSVSSSAMLVLPSKEDAHPGTSTSGNFVVQVYNKGNVSENKPAVNYGLDVTAIAQIDVTFTVLEDSKEWFEGECGGNVVTSCNGEAFTDDEWSKYNWPSNEWYGVTDPALGINTQKYNKECETKKVGSYTYTITKYMAEDERFLAKSDHVQIGLQEWADSVCDYQVINCSCYDENGNLMISFDKNGYPTVPGMPTAPTNVKAVSGGGNATITWDAVDNATSYRVFRSTSLTGQRTLEKVRTSTYYIDTNVDTGKTYYYWIVAYNAKKGMKSGYSANSSVKIVDTFAKSIEINSSSVLSTAVTLKWDMVPGATSYRIYRRNDDGTRKLLYSQSMTEYKDTGLTKGKAYTYEIRAYSKSTGSLTGYSPRKTVRPMAAPTITGGNANCKITWSKNAVATSYRVYRADSLTGAKKLLAPTKALTYTDTTAVKGKKYYYFVAAYDNTTGTLSAYSNAKIIVKG